MRKFSLLPSAEYLRACFDYDPATGVLAWRVRPREHFSSVHRQKIFNTRYAGRVAGTRNDRGYWGVALWLGGTRRFIGGHRIAWVLTTGVWPAKEIDHKNGDAGGNRFENLREATRCEQLQNQKMRTDNTSGFVGVSWHKRGRKWDAVIWAAGSRHYLGGSGSCSLQNSLRIPPSFIESQSIAPRLAILTPSRRFASAA